MADPDPIVTGAWAIASGLALGRLGRRFLGRIGVALGSTAVLFAGLRAAAVQWEPVLYGVAALFGVAIWVYVLGLSAWLWRDVRGPP
jgi:hypothetical protein